MIDEKKITEAVNAYIGYPKEIDEGVGTSMRRDAFKAGVEWFKKALWYDASEEPESDKCILIRFVDYKGNVEYGTDILAPPITWDNWVEICKITKWCYVEDLLPKGGDK